jgi:hypothetical protein
MAKKIVAARRAPAAEQDRRVPVTDRRATDDRREFPPRPEGRRMRGGRRATDPRDA